MLLPFRQVMAVLLRHPVVKMELQELVEQYKRQVPSRGCAAGSASSTHKDGWVMLELAFADEGVTHAFLNKIETFGTLEAVQSLYDSRSDRSARVRPGKFSMCAFWTADLDAVGRAGYPRTRLDDSSCVDFAIRLALYTESRNETVYWPMVSCSCSQSAAA